MSSGKEKFGSLPVKLDLAGINNDDIYFTFSEFTVDGAAYAIGTTARMYGKLQTDEAKTFSVAGTFDPDSRSNLSRLQFKIPATDNDTLGTYDYDIEVTMVNADVFTQVIGTLTITADVG
jgi:hypothetical protein